MSLHDKLGYLIKGCMIFAFGCGMGFMSETPPPIIVVVFYGILLIGILALVVDLSQYDIHFTKKVDNL